MSNFFVISSLYTTATLTELPVFEPNEYFWKNHWQEGKQEKWEVFAEAVREIMGNQGGFPLTDNRMEDKFKYKEIFNEQSRIKNKDH